MAEAGQQFFLGNRRQPTFMSNLLLLLILIGVIIIIILMLFYPWWWGHWGVARVGAGGVATPGAGGNVIIDNCCDGGSKTCPTCPTCPGTTTTKTCEQQCRDYAGSSATAYETCLQSKCGKKPQTCEEKCRTDYANAPTAMNNCITNCNPPETCEQYCVTVYGSMSSPYYNQCLQERCPEKAKQDDCLDSDGNNLNSQGEVHVGSQVYTDQCYTTSEVTEYTCDGNKMKESREHCPIICKDGRCHESYSTAYT